VSASEAAAASAEMPAGLSKMQQMAWRKQHGSSGVTLQIDELLKYHHIFSFLLRKV
jgi:hypothetical protein